MEGFERIEFYLPLVVILTISPVCTVAKKKEGFRDVLLVREIN